MKSPFQSDRLRHFYKRNAGKIWVLQTAFLILIGFSIAWSMKAPSSESDQPPKETAHAEHAKAPQIWTCSMHPQIRRNAPGKCPICGMELVPVGPTPEGMRTIQISETARNLLRIETTPVERREVTAKIRMVGKVEYDETKLAHITAWVSGRLDRLYVDFTGVEVKKGEHLVYIYSEELYAAQEELIQALKYKKEGPAKTTRLVQPIDLVASAREKLRLLGLTAEQIQEIEKRGTPSEHLTIYSPIGGIVIQKLKEEGDRVRTGDRIYTVADLNLVWVKLDAYESDLIWLHYGQKVIFKTEAYPGETFTGRIAFIDPVLNESTRTVKVRVNVPNKDGKLKPEMFVSAVVESQVATGGRVLDEELMGKWISPMHPEIIKDHPGVCDICGMPLVRAETLGDVITPEEKKDKPLVIPVSAALVTGTRAIVYVEVPTASKPTYEGREIVLGPRAGNYYIVRNGLREGELVVTNGNFQLDSALQISAKPSMMTPEGGGGGGGHQHGGSSSENKKMEQKQSQPKKMSLPHQFQQQLSRVLQASDAVTAAIEKSELTQVRAAFEQLGQALQQTDTKLLTGHAAMLWGEFSMLLSNDAVEGGDVLSLEEADQVYAKLKRHIQRVRAQFGMNHTNHENGAKDIEVPAEFQTELAPLLSFYFTLSDFLASDQEQKALGAGSKLKQILGSIQSSALQGDALRYWNQEAANLAGIADQFKLAKDLKSLRKSFALLSQEILVLVKTFELARQPPLYELHCPMAFQGRGAIWLQRDTEVKNPYFGTSMLKCADRVAPIAREQLQEKPIEHKGHDHQ